MEVYEIFNAPLGNHIQTNLCVFKNTILHVYLLGMEFNTVNTRVIICTSHDFRILKSQLRYVNISGHPEDVSHPGNTLHSDTK